jgi:hypothetical protein
MSTSNPLERVFTLLIIAFSLLLLVKIPLMVLSLESPSIGSSKKAVLNRQVPIPADGTTYFGVQLSWSSDSPAAYAVRLGKTPMVYGDYLTFPMSAGEKLALSQEMNQVAAVQGKFMLTLMPENGLDAITESAVDDLGSSLADYNARGVEVFVRFGHEMNGSWYPWCQRPAAYVKAFRQVADAVHQLAPKSAMVWAPNYGGGYPFPDGGFNAQPGTADFAGLDINKDGVLTMADDPYGPYYPGDAYVDWVGLTLYHWGNSWPWGKNDLPEANEFASQVRGTYKGLLGDQTSVPDFYATYAVGHNKPFTIAETSALYNPGQNGASNYDIKMDWINQVFAPNIATEFPRLKMLLWFEHEKYERDTGTVSWSITRDPDLLARFHAALPSRLIFAAP